MRRIMTGLQGKTLESLPDPDSGYLICFGLGLGLHLPALIDEYPVNTLIVVDDQMDGLALSLSHLDWKAVIDTLTKRGGGLEILIGDDPQGLTDQLLHALRGPQFPCLDGTYVFHHHNTEVLAETVQRLSALMPVVEGNDGFFEDEILMLENSVGNLIRNNFHILKDDPQRPLKQMPVLIVGSGPSLNDTIEDIKRVRKNMLLISCGTGLGPLLAAGLKPDFHVEVENTQDIEDIITGIAEQYDLSGITLIGTSTIKPKIPTFFDEVILCWRDVVIPTRLFSEIGEHLSLAGPTVTNLGVRAALSMGFYEYYLFGVDLGSRVADQHHASGSIYDTEDDAYWKSGANMEPFTIEVEGNLGRTIFTNRPFLLTKVFFDKLFKTFSACHFFNASDGVKFDGVTPIVAASLVAEQPDLTPREMAELCLSELPHYDAGGHPALPRLIEYHSTLMECCDRLLSNIESNREGTIQTLISSVIPDLAPGAFAARFTVESAARGLGTGSILTVLQFGHFLYRRLPDQDRPAFMHLFCDALTYCVTKIRDDGAAQASRLIAEAGLTTSGATNRGADK